MGATIPEERTIGKLLEAVARNDFLHEDFLLVDPGLADDLPRSIGDKALAPELDAIAANGALQADPVGHGDVAAIGHGVGPLDGFP